MASVSVGQKLEYTYTGAKQSVTLPPGTYKLEVWGAQGGYRSDASKGGKGGYSAGTLKLTSETVLYVYVGGFGGNSSSNTSAVVKGGFNGGGYRYGFPGGGGATDIRIGADSLYARVIVAGGGGSDGASNKTGMYGGGTTGGSATENYGNYGYGGTQTGHTTTVTKPSSQPTTNSSSNYPGGFGFGGFGVYASSGYGGAGGGGWYGGCGSVPDGSGDDDRGGGGGSGYVYTASSAANYPSGCKLNSSHYLTSTTLKGGNESFVNFSGQTVTGCSGKGAARITVLEIAIKPPSNLTAKIENQKAILSWTASPSTGISGYKVYLDGTLLGTTTSTTYTTSIPTPGKSYTLKVTAYNSGGESSGVTKTVSYSRPAAPKNVQAILEDSVFYVSWDKSTSTNVVRYDVYYGDSMTFVGSSSTTEFEYPYPSIQTRAGDVTAVPEGMNKPPAGTNYSYQAFTVKAVSVECPSEDSYAYVAVPNLPLGPSNIRFESIKDSLAYIVWESNGDLMEGDVVLIKGYKVYVDGALVASSPKTSYDCYLSPGKNHSIEVYTYNDRGQSVTSSTLSLSYDLPKPPSKIDADVQNGELLLSWPASVSEGVVAYRVYLGNTLIGTTPWVPKFLFPFKNDSVTEKHLIMAEKTTLRSFLQPIEAATEYTFSVSSVNNYGEGDKISIKVKAVATLVFTELSITPNPVNTNASITVKASVIEDLKLTVL